MKRNVPVLTLALLSPFVAEILFGATPLSRVASLPPPHLALWRRSSPDQGARTTNQLRLGPRCLARSSLRVGRGRPRDADVFQPGSLRCLNLRRPGFRRELVVGRGVDRVSHRMEHCDSYRPGGDLLSGTPDRTVAWARRYNRCFGLLRVRRFGYCNHVSTFCHASLSGVCPTRHCHWDHHRYLRCMGAKKACKDARETALEGTGSPRAGPSRGARSSLHGRLMGSAIQTPPAYSGRPPCARTYATCWLPGLRIRCDGAIMVGAAPGLDRSSSPGTRCRRAGGNHGLRSCCSEDRKSIRPRWASRFERRDFVVARRAGISRSRPKPNIVSVIA